MKEVQQGGLIYRIELEDLYSAFLLIGVMGGKCPRMKMTEKDNRCTLINLYANGLTQKETKTKTKQSEVKDLNS